MGECNLTKCCKSAESDLQFSLWRRTLDLPSLTTVDMFNSSSCGHCFFARSQTETTATDHCQNTQLVISYVVRVLGDKWSESTRETGMQKSVSGSVLGGDSPKRFFMCQQMSTDQALPRQESAPHQHNGQPLQQSPPPSACDHMVGVVIGEGSFGRVVHVRHKFPQPEVVIKAFDTAQTNHGNVVEWWATVVDHFSERAMLVVMMWH